MYSTDVEEIYASNPNRVRNLDVLIIGAGIGLEAAAYLLQKSRSRLQTQIRLAICDSGPLDIITHMAHSQFPRVSLLRRNTKRFGGKLTFWGVSAPRPTEDTLRKWPYDREDLLRRFDEAEFEMGVSDITPGTARLLDHRLTKVLQNKFPRYHVRQAPLAINKDGRRWCPLDKIPMLAKQGVYLLPRFRVIELVRDGDRIAEVRSESANGRVCALQPTYVVLAVGVEPSVPLLSQVTDTPLRLAAADHLRIDLHGKLPAETYGKHSVDELGICVLLMEATSRGQSIRGHFEIKVAPKALWARGYMQSSDNLNGSDSDDAIYVQVQAISAMHDRFRQDDLLNIDTPLRPVMSARDALLHGELVEVMQGIAAAIGLKDPVFCLRPLLENHHCYGAYRIGGAVNEVFQFQGVENLFILPPASYVNLDDDANPTLKSVVLSQYAMDEIIGRMQNCRSRTAHVASSLVTTYTG